MHEYIIFWLVLYTLSYLLPLTPVIPPSLIRPFQDSWLLGWFVNHLLLLEPSVLYWNLMEVISGYTTESNNLPSGPTSIKYFSSEAWVSLSSSYIHSWLFSGSFLCMPSAGIWNYCARLIIIARLAKKMTFWRRPPYFMILMFCSSAIPQCLLSLKENSINYLFRTESISAVYYQHHS